VFLTVAFVSLIKWIKMKKTSIAWATLMTVLGTACNSPITTDTNKKEDLVSPKGNRAPAEIMTGVVWLRPYETDSAAHWSSAKVTFEAGAHSNWHTHPDKQVIIAVEGLGYLKIKDKPVQLLKKGDVVDIPTGTLHWHGATPNTAFTQVVINPNIEKGVVNWLDRVTDDEYRNPN
jgi:quercetin dioxygenase-like cupin family protein